TRFSRDWSSDVCSSDLMTASMCPAGLRGHGLNGNVIRSPLMQLLFMPNGAMVKDQAIIPTSLLPCGLDQKTSPHWFQLVRLILRSEERRVGKECRTRGA